MKGRSIVFLLAGLLALPALAGNVYRCEGGDGVVSYANKRVPGGKCKLVGSYKAQPAPKPKAVAATPAPAAKSSTSAAA